MAVYGYVRVSTDRQAETGVSIEEQQRRVAARAQEHGWELTHIYIDAGVSGGTPLAKRPQGGKLLAALEPGDTIIAARMDRCFRSSLDALQTIDTFRRRKISLWLLDLGGDVSGNGISELIMTVLAATAQFERSLIKERVKDAKRHQRSAGRYLGGPVPFGWRIGADGKSVEPDPVQTAAIEEMQELHTAGKSLREIARRFSDRFPSLDYKTVQAALARAAAQQQAEPN